MLGRTETTDPLIPQPNLTKTPIRNFITQQVQD